ncbi:TPA: class I tRNA ligase family protein, partial [Candidatus Gracilibacteria bacterium]|nr:class I tRNA ligase family protein [Candidatus Gracilibacteria bacterium]
MDIGMSNAVQKIFSDLYKHDLIVRGYRMINWSTGAQSVLSDDELEYEDQTDTFCYIKCGKFVMGTVRAETKCAHSPLVLHPTENYVTAKFTNSNNESEEFVFSEVLFDDEERRTKIFNQLDKNGTWEKISTHTGKHFEGETFSDETYSGKRDFFVLCDEEVIDINKGTGAMTISVCHSADDYLLAQKYPEKLKDYYTEKIDFDGKMTKIAGELEGVEVKIARKRAIKLMRAKNLIVGLEKDYVHNVPLCYRTGCVIEPMISPQWFIDVNKKFNWIEGVGAVTDRVINKNQGDHKGAPLQQKSLKDLTSEAINRGEYNKNSDLVNLVPNRFNKIYDQWIDNLQDWCISRQIWWGHQIPIWYDKNNVQHVAKEQILLFTRHGESENNVKKIICGDSPLTEKGISLAEKTGKNLQIRNITKIISSPADRALNTAKIIAQKLDNSGNSNLEKNIETWDILKEFHAGKYENQPIDEKSNKTALEKILEDGGYDAIEQYVHIARKFWEKIKTVETDGEILIISHNALTSFLFAVKNGATKETIIEHWKRWKMDNCEVKESLLMIPPTGHENMRQDEDTLDTWFSSALWPFSTLGW